MDTAITPKAQLPPPGPDLLAEVPFAMPFWVISDTHFAHRNIARYCGRPDDHERLMRQNWRALVKPRDVVVHLGDLTLAKAAQFESLKLNQLPGRKYLLKGNHDRNSTGRYANFGFALMKKPFAMPYRDWVVIFVHDPAAGHAFLGTAGAPAPRRLIVHGHIHDKLISDRRFINVSVEHTDYAPVQITDVLDARIAELEGVMAGAATRTAR